MRGREEQSMRNRDDVWENRERNGIEREFAWMLCMFASRNQEREREESMKCVGANIPRNACLSEAAESAGRVTYCVRGFMR